jgi:hypothetical protein
MQTLLLLKARHTFIHRIRIISKWSIGSDGRLGVADRWITNRWAPILSPTSHRASLVTPSCLFLTSHTHINRNHTASRASAHHNTRRGVLIILFCRESDRNGDVFASSKATQINKDRKKCMHIYIFTIHIFLVKRQRAGDRRQTTRRGVCRCVTAIRVWRWQNDTS